MENYGVIFKNRRVIKMLCKKCVPFVHKKAVENGRNYLILLTFEA